MKAFNIDTLEQEILAAAEHVPFGNSAFQTTHFTGGDESTRSTARRVRALLLNIDAKIQTLRENQFVQAECQIDLDEADYKLADPDLDPFTRRRLLLRKEKAAAGVTRTGKLLRDALIEIETMYREWQALPPVESREDFESQEHLYWIDRQMQDALTQLKSSGRVEVGTLDALRQIGVTDLAVDASGVHIAGPAVQLLGLADQTKEIAR